MKKTMLLMAMVMIPAVPALAQMENSEFDVTPAPASQYDDSYCGHHVPGEIVVSYEDWTEGCSISRT